jgi:hypothetical protein
MVRWRMVERLPPARVSSDKQFSLFVVASYTYDNGPREPGLRPVSSFFFLASAITVAEHLRSVGVSVLTVAMWWMVNLSLCCSAT